MKKNIIRMALMGLMLIAPVAADAQSSILSSVKSALSGSSSSSSSSSSSTVSSVVSTITSLFSSSAQATESSIVGTWVYSGPAVVFESESVLTSTAGKLAASKVEDKLSSILKTLGFTSTMNITFSSDGSFSTTIKSKTISGTWAIEDSKLKLTYKKKTVSVTTQLDGSSTLQFVVDASKLLDLLQTLGTTASSYSSSLSTISTLASSVDGMLIGLEFSKQ